ncbi:hypothetical protein HMPREF1393_01694 [Helicobacter pylori GAM103Bi]|nr:hypothetical protein HMPREF1393_01694 [Helicobacter pylori GAM103Bi]
MHHATNPLNIKCRGVSFFLFVCQGGWLENHIIECFKIKG